MAEEQKPVEVPQEETPATTAATEATPATETKAEEVAAPAAGTFIYIRDRATAANSVVVLSS